MPTDQEMIRRIEVYINRYDEELNDQSIPPNGDDYNEIVRGVRWILGGGRVPPINVTPEGR